MPKYAVPLKMSRRISICDAPYHRKVAALRHCIDFAAPAGTPVLAARAGVVIARESRYARTYPHARYARRANYVVIRHADGETTVYAHLARRSVNVRVGQFVRRGKIIARSGQTGYATYPHLHFGVYDPQGRNIPACP